MDRTWEEAYEGNEMALAELEKARIEIEKLQLELQVGTLDRIKLESGLKKLHKDVCEIAAHVPHFKR